MSDGPRDHEPGCLSRAAIVTPRCRIRMAISNANEGPLRSLANGENRRAFAVIIVLGTRNKKPRPRSMSGAAACQRGRTLLPVVRPAGGMAAAAGSAAEGGVAAAEAATPEGGVAA